MEHDHCVAPVRRLLSELLVIVVVITIGFHINNGGAVCIVVVGTVHAQLEQFGNVGFGIIGINHPAA